MNKHLMRQAITLAAAQVGRTGDNPAVGCVIIKNGVVVGQGATGDGGQPHAEEIALEMAGEAARGAVAYVTLEPCAERSTGAPSCSERLMALGIAKVVVACDDLSVMAAGRGVERLRASGVEVESGVLREEAWPLYEAYRPRT